MRSDQLRCLGSLIAGLIVSTGYPAAIALSVFFPRLVFLQTTRLAAIAAGSLYHAGALWAIIPAARNFFSGRVNAPDPIILWLAACVLLTVPFALLWTSCPSAWSWRAVVAVLAAGMPPLAVVGYASPIMAAGILFPATGWVGIALTLACVASMDKRVLATSLALAIPTNLMTRDVVPPDGWSVINTNFGSLTSPVAQYRASIEIQRLVQSEAGRVLIFPEGVIPWWSDETKIFWQATTDELERNHRIALLGSRLPSCPATAYRFDFNAEIAGLNGHSVRITPREEPLFDNVAVAVGAKQLEFRQAIPVPIAMWRPDSENMGARLNLFAGGVHELDGHSAFVLICYEQLLPWSMFRALDAQPDVLIGMSNDAWTRRTPIPRWRSSALGSIARLLDIPVLTATNR